MSGREVCKEWTLRVIDALGMGLVVDPSILAHCARREFLDRFRAGREAPGQLLVPFPVAHLWAMARVDPKGVHAFLLSHQMQLPLLDTNSYPQSLQATVEWIRREPWVHGAGGQAALMDALTRLPESNWDLSTLDAGVDDAGADDLALLIYRASEERQVPVLSFSDVYRSSLKAQGRTVIDAPTSLSAALFGALGLPTSSAAPRFTVPTSLLGQPGPEVFSRLLSGAHVTFGWLVKG